MTLREWWDRMREQFPELEGGTWRRDRVHGVRYITSPDGRFQARADRNAYGEWELRWMR